MGTYQGLYHLLIFDGFFELFCGLALAAPTFLFILGFTKYLRQLKLFRTGKYLELLILCIYTGWKVIFNVVSMLSFKEYYGFTQFFELMGTVLLLVMSLITVFTMRTRKQRFLYAQFLGLLYVCLHLFGLCYTFLQSFTVGFSRIASIVFFGCVGVEISLCSFLTVQVQRRLRNDALMAKRGFSSSVQDSSPKLQPTDVTDFLSEQDNSLLDDTPSAFEL